MKGPRSSNLLCFPTASQEDNITPEVSQAEGDSKGADKTLFKLRQFSSSSSSQECLNCVEDALSLERMEVGEKIEEQPPKFLFSREKSVE